MIATPQLGSKSPSRRALLAGALGGLGALAASAIGRLNPVQAANGGSVILGSANNATLATSITTTTNNSASGTAFEADNPTGIGVVGTGGSAGIYGSGFVGVEGGSSSPNAWAILGRHGADGTGVLGWSTHGVGAPPVGPAKTGVYGYAAQDKFSRGVTGESPAGIGVYGFTSSGYGVYSAGRVYTTKWYEMGEISTPGAPIANRARLFVRDNGLGKTQLCVLFPTGAVQVIKTEP